MPSSTSESSSLTSEKPAREEVPEPSLEEQVKAEKARALLEPGPSWREWMFHSAFRAYYLLGMLIVDAQIIVLWIEAGSGAGLVVSLALALYLEFLLYRYLWYRPRFDAPSHQPFRRSWHRPAEYGRWTPEADLVRDGVLLQRTEQGPNPKEFL